MKCILLAYILTACWAIGCRQKHEANNFLFDTGREGLTADSGFVKITPADLYATDKKIGWIKPPTHAFDSANAKLPQHLLHDGVLAPDSIIFRVDLPNGDYLMRLSLGTPGPDSARMIVSLNDKLFPDTIITPWYRISYRTFCRKVTITEGRAQIKVMALPATNAGMYGIEFRAATEKEPIPFKTPLDQDTTEISEFAHSLQKKIVTDPGDIAAANQLQNVNNYLLACYYYNGGGWSWAVKKTGLSLIYRLYAAADLLEPVIADDTDPLYYKSLYLLAKIYYWLDQEDHNIYPNNKFNNYFSLLKAKYPDDPVVRMYLGEKIFDSPGFDTTRGNAPRWAIYQRETMKRMLKVIDWWVNKKQIANGEMGGKYGDDVELLRSWLPAILGADDSTARKGYKLLADGVWNSDALERGFARHIDDVEHSAELFRDTHPAMFLMNYGDPEYVERCLVSMQNFRDVWTGITPLGHLHFKSYYLSSTSVLAAPPFGIDVALNARAVHPGLWAAWYNHNPTLVKLFSAWGRSWIADAERSDNGKPAGIIPSAVSFTGDRIGGESKEWYDAHLTYDYYLWDHVGHVGEMHNQLLGMYAITGNPFFLKPVNRYADFMKNPGNMDSLGNAIPGSLQWARYMLISGGIDHEAGDNPMGKIFSMAKHVTHLAVYDSLITSYADSYNRYQLTRDKNDIYKGFEDILSGLRYNFPLLTSEVKFTDRVYTPGSDLLMGMYTGHFGAGYEYPSLVATWKNTGPDVSIFVHNGDQRSAAISLYNFGKEKPVRMNTWQLEPGIYTVRQGTDNNDDGVIDNVMAEQKVDLKERVNTIDLMIPSQKEVLVIIEQVKSYGPASVDETDVALTANDIHLPDEIITAARSVDIRCSIHNIGSKAAKNVVVEFSVDHKKMAEKVIPLIKAPIDLKPCWEELNFSWMPVPGTHTIGIRIVPGQKEITLQNNAAERVISIR